MVYRLLFLLPYTLALPFPSWTAPFLDPLLIPWGGQAPAKNVTRHMLYRATADLGTYNMAPMMDWLGDDGGEEPPINAFLAYWKNSPTDEDQPGQRILYSTSFDRGVSWSGTDGTNILFPNMSTSAHPAALFAEPLLHIRGRFYAAASPRQFCVYPSAYPDQLLLRRVSAGGGGASGNLTLGPVFWAAATVPQGFEAATTLHHVLTLPSMDALTQGDVGSLYDPSAPLPCAPPATSGSLKCEALRGGFGGIAHPGQYELTHYPVPRSAGDVILYRSARGVLNLHASVRDDPAGPWVGGDGPSQAGNLTNLPDDNANLNAGTLPDGRVYLLNNAMPNLGRDPLWLSTSSDGTHFNHTTPLVSCWEFGGQEPDQPLGCLFRFQGGSKQSGCQYPQGLPLLDPAPRGFWTIFALNKEDIVVIHVPFDSV